MTQEQVAVTAEKIRAGKTSLGIEFGSTRIKAVLIDDAYHTIAAGDYEWASHLEDGLWSYTQEEIWKGLQTAYARMAGDVETAYGERLTHVGHIGFSAMMHGYLAFDKSGELLVPFRTWQNTNTHEAHEKLSELFQYNIPERWSVAHLYQAVLNHEEHVSKVDYITTLAGYVHWKLTGEKVLGVGDASGMFPIDPATHTYETEFIKRFDAIEEVAAQLHQPQQRPPEKGQCDAKQQTEHADKAQRIEHCVRGRAAVICAECLTDDDACARADDRKERQRQADELVG